MRSEGMSASPLPSGAIDRRAASTARAAAGMGRKSSGARSRTASPGGPGRSASRSAPAERASACSASERQRRARPASCSSTPAPSSSRSAGRTRCRNAVPLEAGIEVRAVLPPGLSQRREEGQHLAPPPAEEGARDHREAPVLRAREGPRRGHAGEPPHPRSPAEAEEHRLHLVVRGVGEEDRVGGRLPCPPAEDRVARLAGCSLGRETPPPGQGGAVDPLLPVAEAQRLRQVAHEGRVGVGIGPPEPVVDVAQDERRPAGGITGPGERGEPREGGRVRPSGDGRQDRPRVPGDAEGLQVTPEPRQGRRDGTTRTGDHALHCIRGRPRSGLSAGREEGCQGLRRRLASRFSSARSPRIPNRRSTAAAAPTRVERSSRASSRSRSVPPASMRRSTSAQLSA